MHPFVRILLDWYSQHGRRLPWRGTDDAYAIWLSEVILQQTRIAQGIAYWERFMKRWPTVELLAAAHEDEVLREWQGLGYYSRARNLLVAARQVTERGGFPHTSRELMKLKGVGAYTAAAIASFAFGEDVAAIDGNVYRVLSRVFDVSAPVDTTKGRHEIACLAKELLPSGRSGDFNQALMDFGSLQCMRAPHCPTCDMSALCEAYRRGTVAQRPVKSRQKRTTSLHIIYTYVLCSDGHIALRRRGPGGIWQGLWEPVTNVDDMVWKDGAGSVPELLLLADNVKHQLTHLTLSATFYLLQCNERPVLPDGYVWVDVRRRDEYAVPRLVEKLYEKVDELSVKSVG